MIIQNESERKSAMDILASDPDAELRERVRKQDNGGYATQICRFCGDYKAGITGNVTTCQILDMCKNCWDKPRKAPTEISDMPAPVDRGSLFEAVDNLLGELCAIVPENLSVLDVHRLSEHLTNAILQWVTTKEKGE